MADLLWWIFAALAVSGAVAMVMARNPVASLLFLVVTLFSLAGIFVLLEAHFIAAIQVIVYAGAIMVLFLFVIMLLNLGEQYRPDLKAGIWLVAGGVASGTLGWLLASALGASGVVGTEPAPVDRDVVGAIADPLFRDYLVPFEVTSILLLAAAVGAVLLAKRRV
ncbi:MAG TPA: NADH-quinone oxidoreductase subunit J [Longimicrobiales bacterium]|jgi:NADH-quinone oxidoreductase subunit J|nr:NADH-quinone oxidoreductase subunit J [Longimicrobiales bacterium]